MNTPQSKTKKKCTVCKQLVSVERGGKAVAHNGVQDEFCLGSGKWAGCSK